MSNNRALTPAITTPPILPPVPHYTDNILLNYVIANNVLLNNMKDSINGLKDGLNGLQYSVSGLKDRVNKLDERVTALEQTRGIAIHHSLDLDSDSTSSNSAFIEKAFTKYHMSNQFGSSETFSWAKLFKRVTVPVYHEVYGEEPDDEFLPSLESKIKMFRVEARNIRAEAVKNGLVGDDTLWSEIGSYKKELMTALENKLDCWLGISAAKDQWAANLIFVKCWDAKALRKGPNSGDVTGRQVKRQRQS